MDNEARGSSILGNKEWLRVKDLSEILSMGQSTIWKMVRNKTFPEPQQITPRLTVWTRQSVQDWVKSKTKKVDASNLPEAMSAITNL